MEHTAAGAGGGRRDEKADAPGRRTQGTDGQVDPARAGPASAEGAPPLHGTPTAERVGVHLPRRWARSAATASVAQAKAATAEQNVSWVRFAIIAFNIAVYYAVIYPVGVPWLAAVVSVVASVYALYVVVMRPYERFPVMRAAAFTTLSDGALIVAWLVATGGAFSVFYPLWFASLVAVVFRYEWQQTAVATALYAVAHGGILAADGVLGTTFGAVQLAYIGFVGALGALLARATHGEIASRVHLEKEGEVERLKELNRFKTGLLNMASHELNTPLTPLKLQLHMLRAGQTGPLNERQQRAITLLDNNVNRLTDLVRDILDVARMQSDRLEIKPQPVAVAPLLEPVLESYRDALDEKGVALEADVDDLVVQADAPRVEQVMHNLLSNALKFTTEGRVVVRVKKRGAMARIEVRDTGLGIAPDKAGGLFEPFSRVHDDDKHRVGGTGLGLYICKGIIEQHGGTITCQSDGLGKGTRFVATLPLASETAAAAAQSK